MSVQLVIAEKPSVARSIAAVIGASEKQNGFWQGGGYLVSWCIGHLVSFAEAGQYDEKYCKWRYEDLPILPQPWQFIVPDEKKQQFESGQWTHCQHGRGRHFEKSLCRGICYLFFCQAGEKDRTAAQTL